MNTWRPQAGPQEKAIRASFVDELFFGGARGGGKSEFLLGDYLADVDTYGEHWKGVLIRRTYPELDEIIDRSRIIFRDAYPDAEYKVGTHQWQFANGATLKLRHLENDADAEHFQGQQYTWIGWDELTSWTDMKAYHKLKACLRTGSATIPNKRIRSSGNPGGANHGNIKKYFVDAGPESSIIEGDDGMKRMYIRSLVTDNKILLERDPGYIKRLEGVGDEALVAAWLKGDWNAFVGQYFTNWDAKKVAVPSFEIPDHWPLFGGLDYIAQMIESCPFTGGRYPQATYADPSMFVKRRLSEVINHSPADVFADHGIFLTRANNDRVTGWRIVNDALIKERFYCFDGWNDALMRTMPTLPRSTKNPEDLDTTAEDHAADELRYAMMHVYKPHRVTEPEPYEGTGQEVIDQLETQTGRRNGRYANA